MLPDIGPVCRLQLQFMNWADDTMHAALSRVPPDRVNHDLGSSFKSLFGTLNHVYLAELVWLKRLQGRPDTKIAELDKPADLTALAQAWEGLHGSWVEWSDALSGDDWLKPLTLRNSQGVETHIPHWQLVLHLVNHGSYHRGQLATMLRQSGITPPVTDLLMFYRTH